MSGGSVEVSVVLPAYNEEATIENTVETTLDTLASFLPSDSFEVIVAEDGCDDRTPEIADRMAEQDSRVRHFHSDERLGRGGALNHAFEAAHGETLVYFDTDLATDMSHLEELVESVRSGDYAFATGSRWMPENVADRPAKRDLASRGFNGLTRLFLRSDLRDHQCGFKAFDRTALFDVLSNVEDKHWFWDTELLVRAQRKGYRIKEFSVDWTPKGDTKVDLVRDVFGMGSQIGRCWWEFSVEPRITRRVSMAVGVLMTVVAVLLMGKYLPMESVLTQMSKANPVLVGIAALVYIVSWPLRGVRYKDILEELGFTETTQFLTGAIFISQTGNLVFPARAGDAVRAYVVKARRGIPYPSGFASLAIERVFDLLTITVLAGTVLLGLTVTGQAADIVQAITGAEQREAARTAVFVAAGVGGAAIAAVGVIVASARSDRNFVREVVTKVSSDSYADYVASLIERFTGDVQTVASDKEAFVRVGASSLAIWSLDVLTAILVLIAFPGVSLDPVTLVAVGFFAVSVGNLAKVLPLSPGGVGLYEAAFTVFVAGLTSISWPVALGAAILDHAVKNIVTLIGGVASMFSLNVSLTQAVEEGSEMSVESETPSSLDD
ncbi:flippase-like domain-containing protein [Haladaptatus pallidirubidus]|uniref:Flippase-like domain-containing protein n=1 Tax=Haladaptatus pallidirubidus TaxID=1008152 RepID=A0AAV3ULP5_9EURY|nr:flippase-like domain-containing protein [Haladaptatus pallidirubidus]